MQNLSELNLLLKTVAADNEIIPDATGGLSVMVRIPAFTLDQVVDGAPAVPHPAFVVGGAIVPEIWISKYQNTVVDGVPQSLPASDPTGGYTYDEAIAACAAKGDGWHLMTNAEWAAIGLWCRRNGFFPEGNNLLGKSYDESVYTAIPVTYDADGRRAHVLTGTGPRTWSHTGDVGGIYDLNGNVVEHAAGARTVYGELQIIPDNDAALRVDLGPESTAWRAVLTDGTLVDPGTPGTLKYDFESLSDRAGHSEARSNKSQEMDGDGRFVLRTELRNQDEQTRFGAFEDFVADVDVPESIKALALFPYEGGNYGGDEVFLNNGVGERVFNRGGAQHAARAGGPFFFSGNGHRDRRSPAVGFRAAYIPGIH